MQQSNRTGSVLIVLLAAITSPANSFSQVNTDNNKSKQDSGVQIPLPRPEPQVRPTPSTPSPTPTPSVPDRPVPIPIPKPLPSPSPTLPKPIVPGPSGQMVPNESNSTPPNNPIAPTDQADPPGADHDRRRHHHGSTEYPVIPTDPFLYFNLFNNSTDFSNGYYPPTGYPPIDNQNTVPQDVPTAPPTVVIPPPPDPANVAALMDNAVNNAPAMTDANRAVREAQAALAKAKVPVLKALKDQHEYQQAWQRRQNAERKLKIVRNNGNDPSDVMSSAQAKLEAGDDVTRMEEKAIAADPTASVAKKQLDNAISKRDLIRAQLQLKYQVSN